MSVGLGMGPVVFPSSVGVGVEGEEEGAESVLFCVLWDPFWPVEGFGLWYACWGVSSGVLCFRFRLEDRFDLI